MSEREPMSEDLVDQLVRDLDWIYSDPVRSAYFEHVSDPETIERLKLLLQAEKPSGEPTKIVYTNWRGETAERSIVPRAVWYGSTEWHPEPQWLLRAFDVEKQADRDFALKDFGASLSQEQSP